MGLLRANTRCFDFGEQPGNIAFGQSSNQGFVLFANNCDASMHNDLAVENRLRTNQRCHFPAALGRWDAILRNDGVRLGARGVLPAVFGTDALFGAPSRQEPVGGTPTGATGTVAPFQRHRFGLI